jgi:hypothetical protein
MSRRFDAYIDGDNIVGTRTGAMIHRVTSGADLIPGVLEPGRLEVP